MGRIFSGEVVTCTAVGRAWARAHARTILVGALRSARLCHGPSASAAAVGRLAHHVGAGVQVRTLHHKRMQEEVAGRASREALGA